MVFGQQLTPQFCFWILTCATAHMPESAKIQVDLTAESGPFPINSLWLWSSETPSSSCSGWKDGLFSFLGFQPPHAAPTVTWPQTKHQKNGTLSLCHSLIPSVPSPPKCACICSFSPASGEFIVIFKRIDQKGAHSAIPEEPLPVSCKSKKHSIFCKVCALDKWLKKY